MENEMLLMVGAWGAAVAGTAAGVKGVGYLIRRGIWGFRRLKAAGIAIARLAAIGYEDAWPNGSTDLPTFLDRLYRSVQKLLEFHRADFADLEAGIRDSGGSR